VFDFALSPSALYAFTYAQYRVFAASPALACVVVSAPRAAAPALQYTLNPVSPDELSSQAQEIEPALLPRTRMFDGDSGGTLSVVPLPRLVQPVSWLSRFRTLTRNEYEVAGERPVELHDAAVVHPELVPAVTFSHRYSVPDGFPFAPQFARSDVADASLHAAAPGEFAAVYT